MSDSRRTPSAICWHCDQLLSGVFTMEGDTPPPEPGNLSFCLYCGALAFFDADLVLRPAPSQEALAELWDDADFRQQFVAFQWTRQRAMLEEKLMGHRGPDH